MCEDEATGRHDTDPIKAILDSHLPYEEKLIKIVDLAYSEGDMMFWDDVPHELLADLHKAMEGREENRKALAKEGR